MIFQLPIYLGLFLCVTCVASWSVPGQRITLRSLSSSPQPVRLNNLTLRIEYNDQLAHQRLTLQGRALRDEFNVQKSLGHFNRERIPERVVHAKGSTFYGVFRVTNANIARYSKASLFRKLGKQTRVAVRFSTSLGERGSSDIPFGEVRGLGVKFYTEDGNWDLLSINLPVFFINDPLFFTQLTHAQKRDPKSDFRNADNLWDFLSLHPESLNGINFLYSDYGLPDGFVHMPGFSVN